MDASSDVSMIRSKPRLTAPAANAALAQCTHFDTSRRFECTQPIIERVADKNARNECDGFSLRVTVERDASPDSTRPADIKRGWDNLFKQ